MNLYKNKVIKLLCGIHPLPSLFSKVGSAPAFLEMIHLSQTIVILEHPSFDSFPSRFPSFSSRISKENSCEKRPNKNTFRNPFFFLFPHGKSLQFSVSFSGSEKVNSMGKER